MNAAPLRLAGLVFGTLVVTAVVLRTLDAVPGWIRDEPRGVRPYASVRDLETEIRTRLLLPVYFPDTFDWPPARVWLAPGDGRPSALVVRDARSGLERLVMCQNAEGDAPIPPRLLVPGRVLQRVEVRVNDAPGVLTREALPDGTEWSDLSWVEAGRRLTFRMYGDDSELMKMARSVTRVRR